MKPTFRIRGLCKEAVMDTQYKLANHKPTTLDIEYKPDNWGDDNTRSYVGPKGWIIAMNHTEREWKITHYHYTDQSLTMMDTDVLPLGRHKWKIENNVCNEGETSDQTLLISGCEEGQFTCDDGKCLDISQRCNNIEVSHSNIISISFTITFVIRSVMMSAMKRTVELFLLTRRNI